MDLNNNHSLWGLAVTCGEYALYGGEPYRLGGDCFILCRDEADGDGVGPYLFSSEREAEDFSEHMITGYAAKLRISDFAEPIQVQIDINHRGG